MTLLKDSFGRVIDDLRISVTDRCNYRCIYCIPEEVPSWLPKREILTFEEIVRVARIMVDLGVVTIRITGGEPLLRQGVETLVRELANLDPGLDLTMTTNGHLLARKAQALADAGLKRINVSLDSLKPERFARMARVDLDAFEHIMEGLAAARSAGLTPIKLNVVVMRGYNDDEVVDFATFARDRGYQVRFIEFMPLDGDKIWGRGLVVGAREILSRIDAVYPLEPVRQDRPEPATVYRFVDGGGEIGVIPSVTEPFCGSCNRIRLTADGQLRTCLFSLKEHDLKALLRGGHCTDEEIAAFVVEAVWRKEPGHRINQPDFVRPARTMSAIGG